MKAPAWLAIHEPAAVADAERIVAGLGRDRAAWIAALARCEDTALFAALLAVGCRPRAPFSGKVARKMVFRTKMLREKFVSTRRWLLARGYDILTEGLA